MDTESLSSAGDELKNCIRHELRAEWEQVRLEDFIDSSFAETTGKTTIQEMCCEQPK